MKKSRLLILLMCIVVLLLCSSCESLDKHHYICEVEEVTSIQIVRLEQYIEEECRFEYTVLSEITDFDPFVGYQPVGHLSDRLFLCI